jgi:hypothetical protein
VLRPTSEPSRLGTRSSTFAASVRSFSEIPTLVINAHRRNVVSRKRNLLVSPDFYNAALTRGDLIKRSTVCEFHRNYLITDACFLTLCQMIDKPGGNWNQTFHCTPQNGRKGRITCYVEGARAVQCGSSEAEANSCETYHTEASTSCQGAGPLKSTCCSVSASISFEAASRCAREHFASDMLDSSRESPYALC